MSQSDEGNSVRIWGQGCHTKQHPLQGPPEQGCVRPALPLVSWQLIGSANRLIDANRIRRDKTLSHPISVALPNTYQATVISEEE
jgi:hypothetical protein